MNLRQRYILISGFLISLGILSILYNFGFLSFIKFAFVIWPVSIILFGIYFVLRGKFIASIITFVNSIVIAVVVLSILSNTPLSNVIFQRTEENDKRSNINPNIKYELGNKIVGKINNHNNQKAVLKFKSESGEFIIRGHSKDLVEYDVKKTFGEYTVVESELDGIKIIDIKFDKERIPWKIFSEKNFVDMKLNPNLWWDLHFDVSRSNLDLDLGYYKVNQLHLSIHTLSNAKLKIEDNTILDTMTINFNITGSSVELKIPENVGLNIDLNSSFTILSFDEDKMNKHDNVYKTLNFDNAKQKVFLKGKVNSSRINVIFE